MSLESDFAVAVVNNVFLLLLFVCCSSKTYHRLSEARCASYYLAGAIYCSWIPVSKGSDQSYASGSSFKEKNVSIKLVACWTADHQHLRKALKCHHIDVNEENAAKNNGNCSTD